CRPLCWARLGDPSVSVSVPSRRHVRTRQHRPWLQSRARTCLLSVPQKGQGGEQVPTAVLLAGQQLCSPSRDWTQTTSRELGPILGMTPDCQWLPPLASEACWPSSTCSMALAGDSRRLLVRRCKLPALGARH